MAKKITQFFQKNLILIGITLAITALVILLISNYKTYIATTHRFMEIFDIDNLNNFFERYLEENIGIYNDTVDEVISKINDVIIRIKEAKPLKEILIDILVNTLIFTLNFLNYFCNIGINIIMLLAIYYHETFHATNLKIKYTLGARIFFKIKELLHFIIQKIKDFIKLVLRGFRKHRQIIALVVLIFIAGNGWLFKIITEVLIFFITYIYHAIKLETYVVISSLGQAIFLFTYPKLKMIPSSIIIILLLSLILIRALSKANFKLRMNHERLKKFAWYTLTQTTFINGAPGVGKTLLNVSLSLISEENYIDELSKELLEYELGYPEVNFADVRKNPDLYLEHNEYLKILDTLRCRGTFLISNFSIYSPYFGGYSKIFDFDYMRKNIKTKTYPLEEYIVISLSEIDKEYNSHDDMKAVGTDGAATFFSTISHDLKRHAKIFCDYQLKDQVPLRIRGNSEYFLTVKKRRKKYPLLLYLYYLPFLGLSKIIRLLISRYETRRETITKKTKRLQVPIYKRNDYNFIYALLRSFGFSLNKVCKFFDQYWYFKLNSILSQEDGGKGERLNLNINLCDLKHQDQLLYDSTFLSFAYTEKKNEEFKNLLRFTSLTPTTVELNKCHSRFYDKLNGLAEISLTKSLKAKQSEEDEFIEV